MKVGETSKKVCEYIYRKSTISKSVAGIIIRGVRD